MPEELELVSPRGGPPRGASPQELKSAWELRGKRSSPRHQERKPARDLDDSVNESMNVSVDADDDDCSETASFISPGGDPRDNKEAEQVYDVLEFSFAVYVLELIR